MNQEYASWIHTRIEEFQRVVGGLIEIYIEMHKGKTFVSNWSAGGREKSFVDMDVRKIGKVFLHRVK